MTSLFVDVEERRRRLRKIMMRIYHFLLRFWEEKLKLNPTKWRFKIQKVIFVGSQLSPDGVSPAPSVVEAITRMPTPADPHALQRYLGMLNSAQNCSEAFKRINPQRRPLRVDWCTWQNFCKVWESHRSCPRLKLLKSSVARHRLGRCFCCWSWWSAPPEWSTSGILLKHPNRYRTKIRCYRKRLFCNMLSFWQMGVCFTESQISQYKQFSSHYKVSLKNLSTEHQGACKPCAEDSNDGHLWWTTKKEHNKS